MAWPVAWPPWPVQAGQIGWRPNGGGKLWPALPNVTTKCNRQMAPPASAFRLRKAVLLCFVLPAYRLCQKPRRKPGRLSQRRPSTWHVFCIFKSRVKCAFCARFVQPFFPKPVVSQGPEGPKMAHRSEKSIMEHPAPRTKRSKDRFAIRANSAAPGSLSSGVRRFGRFRSPELQRLFASAFARRSSTGPGHPRRGRSVRQKTGAQASFSSPDRYSANSDGC